MQSQSISECCRALRSASPGSSLRHDVVQARALGQALRRARVRLRPVGPATRLPSHFSVSALRVSQLGQLGKQGGGGRRG